MIIFIDKTRKYPTLKNLTKKILEVDSSIMRASIINIQENTLYSTTNESQIPLMNKDEEETFAIELKNIVGQLKQLNTTCGKIIEIFIRREKILHAVYVADEYIIFVNYGIKSEREAAKLNEKMKNIIEQTLLVSLHNENGIPLTRLNAL